VSFKELAPNKLATNGENTPPKIKNKLIFLNKKIALKMNFNKELAPNKLEAKW